ncbi:MAG: MFS transporter, partial [Paracoccus sp.]|nr:MFS transporter [Paracoccus sp. (in: a-proteobacteria)]
GALTTLVVVVVQPGTLGLVVAGAIMGGVANPIYAVLLAYTNDYLDQSDMAAASAGLLFIYGVGSFGGPLITGWMMAQMGPSGFWAYMGVLMLALAIYAGWRMTRRRALTPDEQGNYAVITPGNTQLVVGAALDDAQSSGQADAQDAPPPAA